MNRIANISEPPCVVLIFKLVRKLVLNWWEPILNCGFRPKDREMEKPQGEREGLHSSISLMFNLPLREILLGALLAASAALADCPAIGLK